MAAPNNVTPPAGSEEDDPTTQTPSSSPLSLSKVPPVSKPDEAHYDALVKAETNAIEALRKRISELDDKAAEYMSGRDEFIRQRGIQRAKINEIGSKINALIEERTRLQEAATKAQEHGRNLRGQMEQMQRTVGFSTIDEIDKRIAEIQYDMMVSTLTLNEEKKLIADIEKLRKIKPDFAKIAELEERAQYAETTGTQGPRSRLDAIRDELNHLRDARRDEADRLATLQEERNKQEEPLRDIRDERDELRRTMGGHQSRMNQLQSERRAKETEWRAYQAKLRSARLEVERWERQRNQLDADKKLVHDELASLNEGTFDWRSMLAIQVISYMKDQIRLYEEALKEAPIIDEESLTEEPVEVEGDKVRMYQRKKVEAFTAGSKKSKKNKKAPKRDTKAVSDRLQHTLETIKDFSTLGFDKDYPLTIGDCPRAIEKLQKIVSDQKEKNSAHQEVIEKRREKLELRMRELQLRENQLLEQMPK